VSPIRVRAVGSRPIGRIRPISPIRGAPHERLRAHRFFEGEDDDEYEDEGKLPSNRHFVPGTSFDHAGDTFSVAHQGTHVPNDESSVTSGFDGPL
jgi:hypothetical protein